MASICTDLISNSLYSTLQRRANVCYFRYCTIRITNKVWWFTCLFVMWWKNSRWIVASWFVVEGYWRRSFAHYTSQEARASGLEGLSPPPIFKNLMIKLSLFQCISPLKIYAINSLKICSGQGSQASNTVKTYWLNNNEKLDISKSFFKYGNVLQ